MFDEEPEPEPTLDQVRMVWRRWSINVFEGHENEVVSECRLGGDNQAQLRILEAWSVVHIPAQTHTHTLGSGLPHQARWSGSSMAALPCGDGREASGGGGN